MTSQQPPTPPAPPRLPSYRAEDIVAQYGTIAAFLAAVGPRTPLPIPDLHFTEEENRRMDQLLAEERAADSI